MRVRVCLFSHYTVEAFYGRGSSLDLFRTAVPFWGQSTQISSSQSPKRDCGTRKGSTPHPKTDVSKKSNCIPMKHPMAQLYIPSFKKKKIVIPKMLGQEAPSLRNILSEMCYHYRRTRPFFLPVDIQHHPLEQCPFPVILQSYRRQTALWSRNCGSGIPQQ